MIQIAGILLKLTDGRIVLNRRGKTAPVSAGLLATFGGHIESGEDPIAAAARELSEETSLKFQINQLKPFAEIEVSEGKPKYFHMFVLEINDENFEVYEGDGLEIYTINEALARTDLSAALRKTLELETNKNGS